MKKIIKITAIILIIMLMMQNMSSAISPNVNTIEMLNNESSKKYKTNPLIVEEDLSKRSEFERHFIKEDGSYVAVAYTEPVNVERDGEWIEIDNTLEEIIDDSGESILQNKDGLFDVSFNKNLNEEFISIEQDEYSISWGIKARSEEKAIIEDSKMVKNNDGSDLVECSVNNDAIAEIKDIDIENLDEEETKVVAEKVSSKLEYNDVFPGINLEYNVNSKSVKENIIVTDKSNITTYVTSMSLKGLTPVLQENKSISFINSAEKEIFIMPAMYMFDSNKNSEPSYDIDITLIKTGVETYDIIAEPNIDWLNSDERVYPIVIDPVVEIPKGKNDIIDTYISNNYQNLNTNYGNMSCINVGTNSSSVETCIGLIKFSLPEIDPGITITNATMYLFDLYDYIGVVEAKKIKNQWSENVVTWNNFFPSDDKSAIETIIQDEQYPKANYIYKQWNITRAVRDWYENGNNYGLALERKNEPSGQIYPTPFASSDFSSNEYKPYMQIEYIDNSDSMKFGVMSSAKESQSLSYVDWEAQESIINNKLKEMNALICNGSLNFSLTLRDANVSLNQINIYIDSDNLTTTGKSETFWSDSRGIDYKINNGILYKYESTIWKDTKKLFLLKKAERLLKYQYP